MRRVRSFPGYIILTVLLGAWFIPSSGFAQTGIIVNPPNPTEVDSLELIITAGCCMMPVWINSVTIEVSEGLIRIIVDRECGPFMMATLYTHTVMVPPVYPDSYIIEYWVTGSCLIPPNPILTATTIVLPMPVQADGATWGAIKALFQ